MSLPVVLTHEAEADFDAAADWYQAHGDLGARFTTHVREALNRIGQMPESHVAGESKATSGGVESSSTVEDLTTSVLRTLSRE